MFRATLHHIEGRNFAITAGLAFAMLCAIALGHQYLVVYGIGFAGKALGNGALLLLAAMPFALYIIAIVLALIATRAFADRLWTLGLPVALAAGALFAMMAAALTLKSLELGPMGQRYSRASWPIVVQTIANNLFYVVGLIAALAIARPTKDWTKHRPSMILVGLITYIMLESFLLYNVRLTGIQWYPITSPISAFLARHAKISMSAVWMAAFIGLAIWQSRSNKIRLSEAGSSRSFGLTLATSFLIGSGILVALAIAGDSKQFNSDISPVLNASLIPGLIAKTGWVYIMPIFAGMMAYKAVNTEWEAQANWLAAISLAPIFAWGVATAFATQTPYMAKPSFPPLVIEGKFEEKKRESTNRTPAALPENVFRPPPR